MAFEVGEQVGAYTITRRLGAGGMGEVYLARHRHIGRDAAIKVLLPELSQNEDVVARFFTEARATATIRHPGIVEIIDCDVHRTGRAYIVMEFLEGENLAERLVRMRSFAAEIPGAGAILAQVASALGAAHAKGIVHRDLKPDNVFLCGTMIPGAVPLVKILDFGVAKLVADDGQGRNRTRTGSLLGTPTYMSPEQCRGAGSIDHRTDIYALGCMAFEMIAGRPPFVRDGAGEVLVAHLVEKPPELLSLVPETPPDLGAMIGQMLEKDAAARPQSMIEILSRLEGMFGAVPGLVHPGEGLSGAMRLPGARTPALGAPLPTAAGVRTPAPNPTQATPPTVTPAPPAVMAGGTRVMPAVSRTTLSDTASEAAAIRDRDDDEPAKAKRRWLVPAVIAGGVAAVAVGAIAALGGGSSQPKEVVKHDPRPPEHEQAVKPPPPPPVPKPPVEVTIEIASDPTGADVFLPGDETARGHTPLKLAVRKGTPPVQVTLRAAGYNDAKVSLDPAREETGPINVALEKIKREREHAEREHAEHKHADHPSGEPQHHRGGKWSGPRDENDIYKPMGD